MTEQQIQRKATQAALVTRLFIVVLVVFMVATVSGVLYTCLKIRQQQDQNSPTLNAILKVGEQIDSCTNPDGKCYKEGAERQAGAVDAITDRQIAVAACIDLPGQQTEDEIRRCADRILKQAGR